MNDKLIMRYPSAWHGDMWREAAPCGNGVIGALVYGGIGKEIILFNHTDLWRGGKTQNIPDVSDSIRQVRELLDQNRPDLADGVIAGALYEKGYAPEMASPLPLCDLVLQNLSGKAHSHYRRVIDMAKAEIRVSWCEDGIWYTRSTFVSRADNLCYTRITADHPGSIHIDASLELHDRESMIDDILLSPSSTVSDGYLIYTADNRSAYAKADGSYGAVAKAIVKGGSSQPIENRLRIIDADEVTFVTALFVGKEQKDGIRIAKNALRKASDYDTALAAHTQIHGALFHSVDLSLSDPQSDECNEILLMDAYDNGLSGMLAEKLYAFGRYLLICSTVRDGEAGLPTHLIGLWNGTYQCFWAFHMFNVNFEMIYWHALSGNLFPLLRKALDYVEGFTEDFKENARQIFGCRGIYIDSVNTPESGKAACLANHIINWTAGAAWVSQHFYDYWRYTKDKAFLCEHALPFMEQAALFYEDFLVIGKDGKYVFYPSTSPENVALNVVNELGSSAQVSKNAAMDIASVRELLYNLIEGCNLTGMYREKIPVWEKMLSLLPDYRYQADGSLKEWADDFYQDNHAHRHQSHMYGVFPGHSVTQESPEYDAFVKAEDHRMKEGLYAQSSWSMVFMSCVNSRMKRGNSAYFALSEMVKNCCMKNLFTLHNDWRRMGAVGCDDLRSAPLQIDANIGFPAAIDEMLLCSADGSLTLLPALPDRWQTGHIHGIRAVGGWQLDIDWDTDRARVTLYGNGTVTLHSGSGYHFENGNQSLSVTVHDSMTLQLIQ